MVECKHKRLALISFDVEEFDLPREHGGEISVDRGVEVSSGGLEKVMEMLKRQGVRATFFVTGNFAERRPEMLKRMVKEGHEVACHGVDHFVPKVSDVENSKKIVEKSAGIVVVGWRQPRMFKINYEELARRGYKYDSSVNPAWIPGRYNHLDVPRMPFRKKGIVEIPVSVATGMRVPLFWLALHWFPVGVYMRLAQMALKKTGYFATYFHPWEFSGELREFREVPGYIKRNSGDKLVARLEKVIVGLKKNGCEFIGYAEMAERPLDK